MAALTKENTVTDISPLLRLAPKRGISIVAPSVRSGEFVTSSRISLLAYEEKFGVGKEAIEENLKQVINNPHLIHNSPMFIFQTFQKLEFLASNCVRKREKYKLMYYQLYWNKNYPNSV